MQILIYEYAVGEGLAEKRVSSQILSEGFGMLRSLSSDFKEAGHQVFTVLDRELMSLDPPLNADQTVTIESLEESRNKLRELTKSVDAALAIAPEPEGRLKEIVTLLEKGNAISLNSTSESIDVVSGKIRTYEILEENGLPVADWSVLRGEGVEEQIEEISRELGYPLVIKPAEGVGCDSVNILEDESQIPQASEEIGDDEGGGFLVQRYIEGTSASVGLISGPNGSTPLTLNLQMVKLGPPKSKSEYLGGAVPLYHRIRKEAEEVASRTIDTFEGLWGYVGVDLVLSEKGPIIMEINPRLTTSYIGMSEVAEFNPAMMMLDILRGEIPESPRTSGCAFFSKLTHRDLTREAIQRISNADEVVSPPFPVPCHDELCSLALTRGRTLKVARRKFDNFKQRLNNFELPAMALEI